MPRYPIDRATNFIVEEESWQVIEYDHTSVPGTIYLSLTENKINLIYDDIENNIADLDKRAKYDLLLPEQKQIFAVGADINPVFTIIKNGKPYSANVTLLPDDNGITKVIDGKLKGRTEGTAIIKVQLKDFPNIKIPLEIVIGNERQEFDAYIEGPDSIRLARYAEYVLKSIDGGEILNPSNCSLKLTESTEGFASINTIEEEEKIIGWRITANDQNKITTGENEKVEMSIIYNDKEYTKKISIVPLW